MATYRLRISGTWNGGEVWSFGLHGNSAASTAAVADALAVAANEMWSGAGAPAGLLSSLFSDDVIMTTLTVAELEFATGRQLTRQDRDVSAPGTAADDSLPPQCAVVVSLRTELAQAGGRGRYYLPAMSLATCVAGRLSTAAQATAVAATTRFFSSLRGAAITPVLYRRPTPSQPAAALTIVGGNIGDVFDTQRSRRDQLNESRTTFPI